VAESAGPRKGGMTLLNRLDRSRSILIQTDRDPIPDGHDIGALPLLFQPAPNTADDWLPAIIWLDGEKATLRFDDESGFLSQVQLSIQCLGGQVQYSVVRLNTEYCFLNSSRLIQPFPELIR
jgi:hypothetical protein